MRTAEDWGDIKLGDGVRLLLGWRDEDGGLDARPVDLATDVADELRSVANSSLTDLAARVPKPYSGLGDVDADEFLSLTIMPNDGSDDATSANLEETLSTADMVRLSLGAFAAGDFFGRDELFGGGWLFMQSSWRSLMRPLRSLSFVNTTPNAASIRAGCRVPTGIR